MRNRKIVLSATGSLGDLHPFIALAKALKSLGYQPVVATAGSYREKIEAEDIGFVAIRPDAADLKRDLKLDLPEIARRIASDLSFMSHKVIAPYLASSYSDLLVAVEGAALVVTHIPLSIVGALAAERRGIPCVTVLPYPSLFLSAYDPPQTGLFPFVRSPRSSLTLKYNRALLLIWILKQLSAYGFPGRNLRRFQREAALPDLPKDSGALTIGLYSPLLGDVQPDFPPGSAIAGFSFYDSDAEGRRQLDPELQEFLDAGPAPIVFALGSHAPHFGEDIYRYGVEAARKLKRRALLLATDETCERLRNEAAPDVCVRAYVPYSLVFPHAAAVVHHGGIGTIGMALSAGKPQIIVPFFFDQPDNAGRVARLGVGRVIRYKSYTAARVATELATVLDDPKYAARAIEAAEVVAKEDGAATAAKLIHAYLLAGGRADEKATRST
jgi:UDP:flavonoid glycosyltransferase YjiC (YdhE family)